MSLWTDEEDKRLLEIVQRLVEESWMKVAREMEQRSDVQCRYRYYRLLKNRNALMCPQMGEAPILNQQQTAPYQAPSTYSPVQTYGIATINQDFFDLPREKLSFLLNISNENLNEFQVMCMIHTSTQNTPRTVTI